MNPRRLLPLLAPYDPEAMQAVPMSTFDGKVGNEGPVCIEPLADPEGDLAL
ncbi:MAG TPA: hypothetical protein VGN57_12955 [Pirellulaceae bacterium]|nr:hypothetical protein [Pirellulaceae bacterium]